MNPVRLDDALTALQERSSRDLVFAAGFSFDGTNDTALREEAVAAAADAEVAVLFLGLPVERESEGFDRTDLHLPESQMRLVASVLAVNPNVVVVLSNGGVVILEGIIGRAPAILEMWLGGQASGSAAADMLLGLAEPGGRLAETIPKALAHNPSHLNWPGSNSTVR